MKAVFFIASIAVLGIIIFMAWFKNAEFQNVMINQAMSQLLIITESEAQSVEQYILNVKEELEILSTSFAVRKVAKERPTEVREELKYYASLRDGYKNIENMVDSFYLIDKEGKAWNMSSPEANTKLQDFSQMPDVSSVLTEQKPAISSVFKTPDGYHALSIVQPVFDNKEFIGGLRSIVSINRINSLFRHINKENRYYALLMDDNTTIISSPEKQYVGTNILKFLNENLVSSNQQLLNDIISKISRGEKGTFIDTFYIKAGEKPKAKFLVAFMPVRIVDKNWCLFVGLNYNVISGPIIKNLWDNIIFTSAMMLIFMILGISFYIAKRKSMKLEIAQITSDIITKQLHMEIEERKKLEEELKQKLKIKNLPESSA